MKEPSKCYASVDIAPSYMPTEPMKLSQTKFCSNHPKLRPTKCTLLLSDITCYKILFHFFITQSNMYRSRMGLSSGIFVKVKFHKREIRFVIDPRFKIF
jgi:hypothetical protein